MIKPKKIIFFIFILFYLLALWVCIYSVGRWFIQGVKESVYELREESRLERDAVKNFFETKGYNIEIIGAHSNGRSHEGPFLYGWYWHSIEIGPEVIMLYQYDKLDEINDYLEKMDARTRNQCYISKHFVFYYSDQDEEIINTIKEYCESGR